MQDSSAPPEVRMEKRVSTIVGDRLCTNCGYNLTGQPIVRESHYDMLMVRCPECGTVASVQEYPLLGRWAGRMAMLVAAIWFAATSVFVLATSGLIFGSGIGFADQASRPFALIIAQLHQDWLEQQDPNSVAQQLQWQISQQVHIYATLDSTWLSNNDGAALLAQSGGWWSAATWPGIGTWGWMCACAFFDGCFWAVLLAHLRRPWLMLFGLLPVGIAVTFAALYYSTDGTSMSVWGWTTAQEVASEQLGMIYYGLAIGVMLIPLYLGLMYGRAIIRLLIRLLLPPRLRNSLALLWIVDGLSPPRS